MTRNKTATFVAGACIAWIAASLAIHAQTLASPDGISDPHKDRAHTVLSHDLPKLAGNRLKAILVEVRYGPGEASPPHSHPCAVMGYVVDGAIRTQVEGAPETT